MQEKAKLLGVKNSVSGVSELGEEAASSSDRAEEVSTVTAKGKKKEG